MGYTREGNPQEKDARTRGQKREGQTPMQKTKAKAKQARKRILSVTLKQMVDDSPDTSYLGEYSNREETEYAIDRAHSEDCASVRSDTQEAWEKLERILAAVESVRITWCEEHDPYNADDCPTCAEIWGGQDAVESLQYLADEMTECDCGFSGYWDTREYRYFNPNYQNYEGLPEEDIRKYCRQDFDRMESLNSGQWCYIGICAEAEVILNVQADGPGKWHGVTHKITSGGLWGIESDSDRAYITETEKDELANLRDELLAAGFSRRAVSQAFKNVQEVDS
jgi:hypothetical protein